MKKHFNQVMIVIIYMVINASFSFNQTSNIGRGPFELNDNNVITPFPIDTVVISLKFYLIHEGLNRDDPIPNPNAIDISESDVIDFMVDISEAFNPHGIYFHYFQSQIDHIYDSNYYDYPDNYSCDILEYGGQENSLILYLGPAEITHGYSRAMSIPGLRLLVSGSVFEEYSKAIIHELGHCLGLFHTHHDDDEDTPDGCGFSTPDNSACEETISGDNCQVCGDYVCDTNADPGLSEVNVDSQTCNYIPQDGYNPPTDNYMSYAPMVCQNNFTEDQGNRMFNHIFQYEDLRRTAVTWFVIKDVATDIDELLYGSMKFDILATPGTDYLSLYSGEVVHIPLTFFFNDGGIMRPILRSPMPADCGYPIPNRLWKNW